MTVALQQPRRPMTQSELDRNIARAKDERAEFLRQFGRWLQSHTSWHLLSTGHGHGSPRPA